MFKNIVKNMEKIQNCEKLVVSFGAGSGATEMSCRYPCLYLDKAKRSIHAGIINLKGDWKGNRNGVFHSYYDFGKGVYLILQ